MTYKLGKFAKRRGANYILVPLVTIHPIPGPLYNGMTSSRDIAGSFERKQDVFDNIQARLKFSELLLNSIFLFFFRIEFPLEPGIHRS